MVWRGEKRRPTICRFYVLIKTPFHSPLILWILLKYTGKQHNFVVLFHVHQVNVVLNTDSSWIVFYSITLVVWLWGPHCTHFIILSYMHSYTQCVIKKWFLFFELNTAKFHIYEFKYAVVMEVIMFSLHYSPHQHILCVCIVQKLQHNYEHAKNNFLFFSLQF